MNKLCVRKIIVLLLLFIISGCDVNYNITISNDSVSESSNLLFTPSDMDSNEYYSVGNEFSSFSEFIDSYYKQDYYAYSYNYNDFSKYEKSTFSNSNGSGFELKYDYNLNNYGNSNMFNACRNSSYNIDDKNIIIDVKNICNCFYNDSYNNLDTVRINIKCNLKVLNNNADSVRDNIYTWIIDKEKCLDKSIYIKIKKSQNYGNVLIIISILVILILVVIFMVVYIRRKNIQNNSL